MATSRSRASLHAGPAAVPRLGRRSRRPPGRCRTTAPSRPAARRPCSAAAVRDPATRSRSAKGTARSGSSTDGPRTRCDLVARREADRVGRDPRSATAASTTAQRRVKDSKSSASDRFASSQRRALTPTRRRHVEERPAGRLVELEQVGAGAAGRRPQPVQVLVELLEVHRQSRYLGSGGVASGIPGSSSCSCSCSVGPGAVGPELLEHGVHEPHELGVVVGDGHPVVRHRVALGDDPRRAPRRSGPGLHPVEERVVAEVGGDLALLQGEQAVGASRDRVGHGVGEVLLQDVDRRRAGRHAHPLTGQVRGGLDAGVLPHEELLDGGVVLAAERHLLPAARRSWRWRSR